jgi:hypothetical protein
VFNPAAFARMDSNSHAALISGLRKEGGYFKALNGNFASSFG